MIDRFTLSFTYDPHKRFFANPGYHLYGCLMPHLSDDTIDRLHANERTAISQSLLYHNHTHTAEWSVSSFDEALSEELDTVFRRTDTFTLEKDSITLCKTALSRQHIDGFPDLRQQIEPYANSPYTVLSFQTATALKRNGQFLLYPEAEWVIKNLWNTWNQAFPNTPLDDDNALALLVSHTSISAYSLSSAVYFMKNTAIHGFTGTLTLYNHLSPPLRILLQVLLTLASYTGVGVKTSLGMGRTEIKNRE